jgi:hypothetical protein
MWPRRAGPQHYTVIFLEFDGKVDWLDRCVAEQAIAFAYLRDYLLRLQLDYTDPYDGIQDPAIRWVIEQLYDRLPSVLGQKLIPTAQLWQENSEHLVIALFWGQEAEALKLPPPPPEEPDDNPEGFKLEPPSSGNAAADLMASLILVDGTVAGARSLLANYSIEFLQAMTRQVGELRTPESERLEKVKIKYLKDLVAESETNNPELYHQILGLAPPQPLE